MFTVQMYQLKASNEKKPVIMFDYTKPKVLNNINCYRKQYKLLSE